MSAQLLQLPPELMEEVDPKAGIAELEAALGLLGMFKLFIGGRFNDVDVFDL